jgi:hypothetical protein
MASFGTVRPLAAGDKLAELSKSHFSYVDSMCSREGEFEGYSNASVARWVLSLFAPNLVIP